MLFANLMFWKVSTIHCSFLISGSETSDGPAYVSLVQLEEAPEYPSKKLPTELFRFRSTPQELRLDGIPVVAVSGQWRVMFLRWLAKS
jgi:hypothetical protein